mmetsp:Transcript_14957/g.50428  ORF Transcript_14957/g.50428 Transcript_14957/m.50428 type:complete len:420 (-) Transcript_14957:295-1554(-)
MAQSGATVGRTASGGTSRATRAASRTRSSSAPSPTRASWWARSRWSSLATATRPSCSACRGSSAWRPTSCTPRTSTRGAPGRGTASARRDSGTTRRRTTTPQGACCTPRCTCLTRCCGPRPRRASPSSACSATSWTKPTTIPSTRRSSRTSTSPTSRCGTSATRWPSRGSQAASSCSRRLHAALTAGPSRPWASRGRLPTRTCPCTLARWTMCSTWTASPRDPSRRCWRWPASTRYSTTRACRARCLRPRCGSARCPRAQPASPSSRTGPRTSSWSSARCLPPLAPGPSSARSSSRTTSARYRASRTCGAASSHRDGERRGISSTTRSSTWSPTRTASTASGRVRGTSSLATSLPGAEVRTAGSALPLGAVKALGVRVDRCRTAGRGRGRVHNLGRAGWVWLCAPMPSGQRNGRATLFS